MRRVLAISTLVLATAVPAIFAEKTASKSKGEVDAYNAIMTSPDPDSRIKAAETFLTKYSESDLKASVLFVEAYSYQQKNDYEKLIVYAERTLDADPKHYGAMLLLATSIGSRTREFDLDREEKLARVEKYANAAMEIVKDAPKPNLQVSDEQWALGKKEYIAQAHEALGFAAIARKNFDVAITELKLAITDVPDPVPMVRLAQVYNRANKPDDALALLDKVMAIPDLNPNVRQFAQAEKVRAMQMKGAGSKPAASAAPPAPTPAPSEPKKQ